MNTKWINMIIPGSGMILLGYEVLGLLVALLFTVAGGFALLATLLVPDDVSPTMRGLSIGIALGTYIGAQIRHAQTMRDRRQRELDARRKSALLGVRRALLKNQASQAWELLQPIIFLVEEDLAIAYRVAQVLTARGDGYAALAAWRRVKRLDQHRIYSMEVLENERTLQRRLESEQPSHTSDAHTS